MLLTHFTSSFGFWPNIRVATLCVIGLYRENAIAIESEAKYPFGGNVYYVTMQIMLHLPEFARKESNLHCDVVHIRPTCTTKWVFRLTLDHAIAAIRVKGYIELTIAIWGLLSSDPAFGG